MPVWPEGFERVPDEAWTTKPVKELALDYDTVEQHGWYDNLDPTVQQLTRVLKDGDIVMDYSGGTGILIERLLDATDADVGVLNVDSSRKFLRLCLEKFEDDERVAFRLIRYLDEEGRLEHVHEVLEQSTLDRGLDAVVSTNAVHLYYNLDETIASWRRVIREDGLAFVQSGNVDRADRPDGRWIIDATVEALDRQAREIVRTDDTYAAYRDALEDEERMQAYDELRERYFLPARDIGYYLSRLEGAGFQVDHVAYHPIEVDRSEWADFLTVYHEGVLGWIGGAERIEGEPPSPEAVGDRKALIHRALEQLLDGRESFEAEWIYMTCVPA